MKLKKEISFQQVFFPFGLLMLGFGLVISPIIDYRESRDFTIDYIQNGKVIQATILEKTIKSGVEIQFIRNDLESEPSLFNTRVVYKTHFWEDKKKYDKVEVVYIPNEPEKQVIPKIALSNRESFDYNRLTWGVISILMVLIYILFLVIFIKKNNPIVHF